MKNKDLMLLLCHSYDIRRCKVDGAGDWRITEFGWGTGLDCVEYFYLYNQHRREELFFGAGGLLPGHE